jgi:hypothetical protein
MRNRNRCGISPAVRVGIHNNEKTSQTSAVIPNEVKDLCTRGRVHRSFTSFRMTRSLCLMTVAYTISIFALARNCLARFDLNFSYLLFCKSVFSSFLTSASGLLRGGV